VLEIPKGRQVSINSLGTNAEYWSGKVGSVQLIGNGGWFGGKKLAFIREKNGLHITLPDKFEGKIALALKVQP